MIRSWVALAVAGVLMAASVVLGLLALAGPVSLVAAPLALLAGATGYRLWQSARDRIVESVYDDVGGNPLEQSPDDDRRAEDWHRGGRVGDASATDGGRSDASEDDDGAWADQESDPDEWPWEGPFWRERGETDDRRGAGTGSGTGSETRTGAAGRSGGDRTRSDDGDAGSRGGTDRWWERDDWGPSNPSPSRSRRDPAVVEAYEVLGLEPGADAEAIRRAYRERVKETHPDTPGGSTEAFRRVRDAYELLDERVARDTEADAGGDADRERGVG